MGSVVKLKDTEILKKPVFVPTPYLKFQSCLDYSYFKATEGLWVQIPPVNLLAVAQLVEHQYKNTCG